MTSCGYAGDFSSTTVIGYISSIDTSTPDVIEVQAQSVASATKQLTVRDCDVAVIVSHNDVSLTEVS